MPKKNSELNDTGMIRATIDPVLMRYLDKFAKTNWVKAELKKKVNEDVYNLRFSALEKEAESTQQLMSEHKGKLSAAPKRHEMNKLETEITGWSGWLRRTVIGVILFLIGTGGVAVWNYSALNSQVEVTNKTIESLAESIKSIGQSQVHLERKFELLHDTINRQSWMPMKVEE
jgi:predicted  nucleic acid-binding Zn-ribbon protein